MRIQTTSKLIADNGTKFSMYDDIAFTIFNKETNHLDRVICRIIGMQDSDYNKNNGYIVGDKIEINRDKGNGQCIFYFKDMMDINYVSVG